MWFCNRVPCITTDDAKTEINQETEIRLHGLLINPCWGGFAQGSRIAEPKHKIAINRF